MLLHMRDTEGKEWLETSSLQQAAHMLQVSLSISRTGSLTHFPLARARANCLALSLAREMINNPLAGPLPGAVALAVYLLFSSS